MRVIISFLAATCVFQSAIVVAKEQDTLTVNAFVTSVCSIDNASLNFEQRVTAASKYNTREGANKPDLQGLIPLSVSCKNSTYNQTYLTTLTSVNEHHGRAYSSLPNQVGLTIYY